MELYCQVQYIRCSELKITFGKSCFPVLPPWPGLKRSSQAWDENCIKHFICVKQNWKDVFLLWLLVGLFAFEGDYWRFFFFLGILLMTKKKPQNNCFN